MPKNRLCAAVLMLAAFPFSWPLANDADLEKGPPPPEYPMTGTLEIELVPAPNPLRPADDRTQPEPLGTAGGAAAAASAIAADDLTELVEMLRARLRQSQDRTELPLGSLASDLDQARRDVEHLAELLLRKEVVELQQRAAQARTEQQMGWLAGNLEAAEEQLARLHEERDRVERLAADSAARAHELAESLIVADDERRRLEASLESTEADAETTRRALAAASRRISAINKDLVAIETAAAERLERYEAQVVEAEAAMRALEAELATRQQAADELLLARNAEIARLADRQQQARDVLVRALSELDALTDTARDEADLELVQQAQAAGQARRATLANMGFRRDDAGNLVPPAIEQVVDFAAIEPAAGPSCVDEARRVALPYLQERADAEWHYYTVGTVYFADAAAEPLPQQLQAILECLKQLSADPSFYFKLIGHTDSRGAASFNRRLSLERAQKVRDILAESAPVQPWRLFTQGRGPDFPIEDDSTPDGQAHNRRVEVFAVRTGS
jgi:outer membrane protein OmpA-like peptidoglycan-associated protein